MRFVRALGCILALLSAPLGAQEGTLRPDPPQGITVPQLIQKFTAREKEFKNARKRCTYRQTAKFQALQEDKVIGEYEQVADVSLDDAGKKIKNVVFGPQPSMTLSPEDVADIESRLYFTLSTDELAEYDVQYKGQQQQDDLNCYVFDITPKQIEKGARYFQGRLWVDDRDLQIVKMEGKSAPDIYPKKKKQQPNLFPKFTTYRELLDGKYWYPTYSLTDDVLHFPTGDVKMKGTVRATQFHCPGTDVTEKKKPVSDGPESSAARQ